VLIQDGGMLVSVSVLVVSEAKRVIA
jgi:hypothetical protein